MLAGADFGEVLVWVIVAGAVLKFALNEGVARWQLATGTSLLDGWGRHLGRPFQVYFLLYLLGWSFVVAGGLMSACGVAAHALVPAVSIRAWAVLHSVAALVLVAVGRYSLFEGVMKGLIGMMVLTLLLSVTLVGADVGAAVRGLIPTLPPGSATASLSLMGGVGGSVTLLSYGYWIRERGWAGPETLGRVRVDLAVGYALTGLFGVAMLLLAAVVLGGGGGMPAGSAGLVACGEAIQQAAGARLGSVWGQTASAVFLVGVWGAVFTSTLGVWNGVPYLFADFLRGITRRPVVEVNTRGWAYRGYLLYLALPPMVLLVLDRPIWVIKVYPLAGGLFMPLLAASLLWLNSRRGLLGATRNGPLSTLLLWCALALFGAVLARQLVDIL